MNAGKFRFQMEYFPASPTLGYHCRSCRDPKQKKTPKGLFYLAHDAAKEVHFLAAGFAAFLGAAFGAEGAAATGAAFSVAR